MVLVVIIGVLATVVYPSYTNYIAKGVRGKALAVLTHSANLQEQYYFDHHELIAKTSLKNYARH